MIFSTRPDIVILVTDHAVTAYRAGLSVPVSAPTLAAALEKTKAKTARILLETSEISLHTEHLPRAGWLDQRKLVRHQLDFHAPDAALRAAVPLPTARGSGKRPYLFVSAPETPLLHDTYRILARLRVRLLGIALFPVEFWGHERKTRHRRRLTLLGLGTHVRLIAEEPDTLALTRVLPRNTALDASACAEEINLTQSYLLRHGWQPRQYQLRAHDVPALATFANQHMVPLRSFTGRNPLPGIVQALLTGRKPTCSMLPPRLQARQQTRQTFTLAQKVLRLATAAALALLLVTGIRIGITEWQNDALRLQLTMKPQPDAATGTRAAVAAHWRNSSSPLLLAVALGNNLPPAAYLTSFDWQPQHASIAISNLPIAQQNALVTALHGFNASIAPAATQTTGILGDATLSPIPVALLQTGGAP